MENPKTHRKNRYYKRFAYQISLYWACPCGSVSGSRSLVQHAHEPRHTQEELRLRPHAQEATARVVAYIGLGLCDVREFKVQMLNRIPMLKFITSAPISQNRCCAISFLMCFFVVPIFVLKLLMLHLHIFCLSIYFLIARLNMIGICL